SSPANQAEAINAVAKSKKSKSTAESGPKGTGKIKNSVYEAELVMGVGAHFLLILVGDVL
ncbi:MAG: hypothetical protein WBO34_03345, partial [Gammaproteobacteria bacterium]